MMVSDDVVLAKMEQHFASLSNDGVILGNGTFFVIDLNKDQLSIGC
jgi:hypothetical protein